MSRERRPSGSAAPGVPRRGTEASIDARVSLMMDWVAHGVPAGRHEDLAASLTQVRRWDEPGNGIHPIGSPNTFTTTNVRYGEKVRLFASLQKQLLDLHAEPEAPRRRPARDLAAEVRALEDQRVLLACQFSEQREEALAFRARLDQTMDALEDARLEIKDLKRAIAAAYRHELVEGATA